MDRETRNNAFELQFHIGYFNKLCWALELALLCVIALQLLTGKEKDVSLVLGVALAAIVGLHLLVRRGYSQIAKDGLLLLVTITVSWLAWRSYGIRDEAVIVFPALIIFSSFVGHLRTCLIIGAYSVATILVLGGLGELGLYSPRAAGGGLYSALLIIVVLLMTTYAAYVIGKNVRDMFKQLQADNLKIHESQDRIQRLVNHDALTSLPNRILAQDRFNHALSVAGRRGQDVYLMFLDLDDFKVVNDSLGHQSGDQVLIELSRRLQGVMRKSDTVSRLGGDEFLFVLEDVAGQDEAAEIAAKVLHCVKQPIAGNSSSIVLSGSLGIAVAPHDGEDFDTLCKHADMAMYHTKNSGRDNYHFFDQNMNAIALRRSQLLADMRFAIENGELEVLFQPKVSLQDSRVNGAEALLRWHHSQFGTISPTEFIPLAERSGIILDISAWVMMKACLACQNWRDAGYTDMTIAVNVSPVDFHRERMTELVESILVKTGLPASALELELTESLLLQDSIPIQATLQALRKRNVCLTIDDFGTGYSNLAYLKRLDVSVLKIDRIFIKRLVDDEQDRALVRAIVQIADSFNLSTVAEGVEDRETAELAKSMGCNTGQGFYWSAALSEDDFFEFLKRSQK